MGSQTENPLFLLVVTWKSPATLQVVGCPPSLPTVAAWAGASEQAAEPLTREC